MMRLLLANQDPKLTELYVQHMKSHFQVDSVSDGLTAVRKFKLSPPSIIVSDYHLPKLSGISLLKFVRDYPTQFVIPFVFLSTYHDITEALNLGANDWLDARNCSPDYLLERIYHHLKTNKHGLQIHRA